MLQSKNRVSQNSIVASFPSTDFYTFDVAFWQQLLGAELLTFTLSILESFGGRLVTEAVRAKNIAPLQWTGDRIRLGSVTTPVTRLLAASVRFWEVIPVTAVTSRVALVVGLTLCRTCGVIPDKQGLRSSIQFG